jgi:hypothetical protein
LGIVEKNLTQGGVAQPKPEEKEKDNAEARSRRGFAKKKD